VSLQLQIDEMSLKLRPHHVRQRCFFFVFARSHLPTVGPSAVFFFFLFVFFPFQLVSFLPSVGLSAVFLFFFLFVFSFSVRFFPSGFFFFRFGFFLGRV
jgi:hypothetical protein